MRDDFDVVVAERFKVLDDVPVPDTWSRVLDGVPVADTPLDELIAADTATMIELETPGTTTPCRMRPQRVLVGGILAAAATVAIVVVATRDQDAVEPAERPAPTITTITTPTTPLRALFGTQDEHLAPGTYYVDEIDGISTPQIFVTIGAGWTNFIDGSDIGMLDPTPTVPSLDDGVGFITFSRPGEVYLDACRHDEGDYHPGPVNTLDGLVAALHQQGGWVAVTAPTAVSIDGYSGTTFQRIAPADFSDCTTGRGGMRLPELNAGGRFHSWVGTASNFGGSYYEPSQAETLLILDIDGTVVVINANVWAGSSASDRAEFASVLASIHINHRLGPADELIHGRPTPR